MDYFKAIVNAGRTVESDMECILCIYRIFYVCLRKTYKKSVPSCGYVISKTWTFDLHTLVRYYCGKRNATLEFLDWHSYTFTTQAKLSEASVNIGWNSKSALYVL